MRVRVPSNQVESRKKLAELCAAFDERRISILLRVPLPMIFRWQGIGGEAWNMTVAYRLLVDVYHALLLEPWRLRTPLDLLFGGRFVKPPDPNKGKPQA